MRAFYENMIMKMTHESYVILLMVYFIMTTHIFPTKSNANLQKMRDSKNMCYYYHIHPIWHKEMYS